MFERRLRESIKIDIKQSHLSVSDYFTLDSNSNILDIFKKQLEWLSSWEEVVVMFDEDDAGRAAAESVAHILPAGKSKIARLSMKDPNEMLLAKKGDEVIRAFWDAKVWRPDDIVDGTDLYKRLTPPKANDNIPYPYQGLNNLTHGLR